MRTRSEQGLSRSEHKVSGSVPVLSRSLHKSPQSLHGVKNPNFMYSHVDFMVLCERGFSWLNHTRITSGTDGGQSIALRVTQTKENICCM